MLKRTVTAAALAAVLGCLWETFALAATTRTADLQVAAAVGMRCSIATSAVSFGLYQPLGPNQTNPLDANGFISLNCTRGRVVRVNLGQGLFPAAGSTDGSPLRQMGFGPNRLSYNLYTDAAHTDVWDNDPPGERPPTNNSFPWLFTVYGRIPAGQGPTPGTYSDTVVATVTF
jgi:spore coat protein U-like protein